VRLAITQALASDGKHGIALGAQDAEPVLMAREPRRVTRAGWPVETQLSAMNGDLDAVDAKQQEIVEHLEREVAKLHTKFDTGKRQLLGALWALVVTLLATLGPEATRAFMEALK